jgi:hypothetical protein
MRPSQTMARDKEAPLEELLPIELRLLILESELERLESDARWVEQRRSEVLEEIEACNTLLAKKRRQNVLRRVK